MADIHIKPKSSPWGWLLAIILLVAVAAGVYYFLIKDKKIAQSTEQVIP